MRRRHAWLAIALVSLALSPATMLARAPSAEGRARRDGLIGRSLALVAAESDFRSRHYREMLAVQSPDSSSSRASPPPRSPPRPSSGDSLQVYLVTMGQGDVVWERFGHSALGVRDLRAKTDIVYNWGLFSFAEPGFITKFARGEMNFWMAGSDAGAELVSYISRNRSITIQELNLTPAQRLALSEFVAWNAREENKYYRYDYFRDNCSTRVRDVLDRALGGALRAATDTIPTPYSYREQGLRLTGDDLLVSTGIDLGLGRPSDHPQSAWEEMFIPMLMRAHVRALRVPNERGQLVPLVASERNVFDAKRAPERVAPPNRAPAFLLLSTGIGALMLATAGFGRPRAGAGLTSARALTSFWSLLVGIVGAALVFLQTATTHSWTYWNLNTLPFNPLWLALAILIPFARHDTAAGRFARGLALVGAGLTVLAMVIACIPAIRQDNLAVLLLAAPANLAAALVVHRGLTAAPDGV